jgi:dephospho-CoA kinase
MHDPSASLIHPGWKHPLSIGLTGGIGSGKSTVAKLLKARGAGVVDTDQIARDLTCSAGRAIPALRKSFGNEIISPDGGLDRSRMRQLAFSDDGVRRQLESVLHPLVMEEAERQAQAMPSAPVVVFDVPLLVESAGWLDRVDRVLVIDCSEQTQIDRVVTRSGWPADTARLVMGAQASRAERLQAADDVIVNDGLSLVELESAVDALWAQWRIRVSASL